MTNEHLNEDGTIIVEFSPQPGLEYVSLSPSELAQKSIKAIDSAMETVSQMAARISESIDNLSNSASHVEVEFGLKLSAETGAIIAKAATESTIKVKLSWDRKPPTDENAIS